MFWIIFIQISVKIFKELKTNNFSGCYSWKCVRKDKQFPKKCVNLAKEN